MNITDPQNITPNITSCECTDECTCEEPLEVKDTLDAIIDRLPTDEPPPEAYLLDYATLRKLYKKTNLLGKGTRILQNYTIRESTVVAWRDFVHTFTGKPVTRGGGVSSPLVELAMRMFMGVIADYEIEEIANELKKVLNERQGVVKNMRKLMRLLIEEENDA